MSCSLALEQLLLIRTTGVFFWGQTAGNLKHTAPAARMGEAGAVWFPCKTNEGITCRLYERVFLPSSFRRPRFLR
ncbi:hypothetical protein BQ8794_100020 [Mesorhizobium prunaredense]|uniref:Uncharacterized protein n=1 Tax=Mesorhizobium prunaredense TaxID=1631249 RepID=A0A1R3UZR9_9HYPH|nr:hypothetical protein BQ8794_100020 [Mesorhizobium prunaredense]